MVMGVRRGSAALGLSLLLWLSCAILLVAGVHRPTSLFLCASALALASVFRREFVSGFGGVSALCGVGALWSLLGAIPLPCAWLEILSPRVAEIWRQALSPLDAPPSIACHLSLAPAASLLEGAKFATYAVLAALASSHAQRRGLGRVLAAFLGLGSGVALITIAHALASAQRLFGLYRPEEVSPSALLSVFLNPNTLAGFLNLSLFCGLAASVADRRVGVRLILLAGVALCLGTVILTGSRGGVLALALGLATVPWLLWRRRRARGGVVLPTAMAVLLGSLFAFVGASSSTWADLFGSDISKLLEYPKLISVMPDFWAFGLGRGAYASMSANVLAERSYVTHIYVENFAISWLLEWGCLFGGAALLSFACLLRPRRLNPAGRRHVGLVLLGIYCVLGQNFVDLGLELPALAGAIFVLTGSLEGVAQRSSTDVPWKARRPTTEGRSSARGNDRSWTRLHQAWERERTRGLLAGFNWGVLAIAVTLAAVGGPSLRQERAELRALALSPDLGPPQEVHQRFQGAVVRAMSRWPGDPYFPLVAAQEALLEGRDALPFAGAALRRAPETGAVHLTVADALLARGARLQAIIHLRRALAADPGTLNAVMTRAPQCSTELAQLRRIAPQSEVGAEFLLRLVHGAGRKLTYQEKRQLLVWAREIAPSRTSVLNLEAELLLAGGGEASWARVKEIARLLPGPPACDGLVFEARVLAAESRLVEAVDLLERCATCAEAGRCSERRLLWAQELGDAVRLRIAEDGYYVARCLDVETCAAASEQLGRLAGRRRDWTLASKHLAEAVRRVPTPERLRSLTDAALRSRQTLRARHAYERFLELGGKDSELAVRIGQTERAAIP